MNQKLIFLDIDGTLCVPGSNVPPTSALEAIRKAREAGHLVFLCTGRNLGMLSPLLGYGFDGVVGSSGGYVTCGDTVIYDCPMTPEQQSFERIKEETEYQKELYRRKKAEKRQLAHKRLADQAAKRKARETR